jgi:phospholipase C
MNRARATLAATAAILTFSSLPLQPAASSTPDEDTVTPVQHVITLMQENHSFDNYFGTYPGADGFPPGLCVPRDTADPSAGCAEPFPLGDRPIVDLGHSEDVFDAQFNDGRMDGFIEAFADTPRVGDLPLGYYDDADLPYYWNLADEYVLFDRFFTSASGGSVRNHFYWVAGHPGNTERDTLRPEGFDEVTTIFDRLQDAGVSWKFYVQNYDPAINFRTPGTGDRAAQIVWVPILNISRFLDDPELSQRIVPLEEYFTDLRNGTLPAVAYMVPSGASEHPPGSIQAGERFVRTLLTALMRSSAWERSAFVWTYDDWGGWYDHVPPPIVDEFGYGFRAPALLVSPYAKRGHIDSTTLDFTSILRFIQHNWQLEPLAERDANANNLLSAFDFDAAPRRAVLLPAHRDVPVVEETPAGVVYALYGAGLGFMLLVVILAAVSGRHHRATVVT